MSIQYRSFSQPDDAHRKWGRLASRPGKPEKPKKQKYIEGAKRK